MIGEEDRQIEAMRVEAERRRKAGLPGVGQLELAMANARAHETRSGLETDIATETKEATTARLIREHDPRRWHFSSERLSLLPPAPSRRGHTV